MDQRILEFIGDLRRAELRISPSEAVDALAASAEIGLEDRDTFKSALASTLVKEARDLADVRPPLRSLLPRSGGARRRAPEGPRARGPADARDARPPRARGRPRDGRPDRADAARRGRGHGDGHPRPGPGRGPRAAHVLPPDRLLLAAHLRQVRLGVHRARSRAHHADAGGEGARSRPARPDPQLSRPAARGLPPHDPPARGARARAPRVPRRARSSPARCCPTSRCSRSRRTRSPR